jgi:AraC family transcriptional regulator
LSLEEIAREAGLSRFHTLRLFKRAYGETPARRVARLRMERAKDLLATGEEPITEIAFRCGYDNSAHFARDGRALQCRTRTTDRLERRKTRASQAR